MKAHLFSAAVVAALAANALPESLVTSIAAGADQKRADGQHQAAPKAAAADLAGMYRCEGTTAEGHSYRGVVDIVRHASTYQLMWMLGGEQHVGLGIVTDDGRNLAVSYFGDMPGVVSYRVVRDATSARLIGQWTAIAADGQVYTETLTRVGPGSGRLYFRVEPPSGTIDTARDRRRPA